MPQYPCFNQTADSYCAATPTYEARECVSYTAWRGSLLLGHQWPKWWGFAWEWPNAARAAKFVVNGTPAVNSIYCAAPNTHGAGPKGHVAWVIGVGSGHVTVAEYNFLVEYGYDERDTTTAGVQFIHLPNSPPPPPKPDPPAPIGGPVDMIMYVRTNGSVFLLTGGTLVLLGSGPDETYLASLGVKYLYEKDCTPIFAANLNKLPVV